MTAMQFKLYNTQSRSVEILEPATPGHFKIYCCGPTVYSYQHVGNFKTFINEDTLVRALRYLGYTTTHVTNITDVGHNVGDGDEGEDKMAVAAKRESRSILDIAKFYTDKFLADWKKLNLLTPDILCKATDHILEMIELIKRIEANGFCYESGGNIYFDVQKFKQYGSLANLNLEDLRAGARIEIDKNKRHPADFVLWFTKSKYENHELQWESPWGRGYPGWHIECSAMSIKYLGDQFDIHCGGIDHIPVHHTNEIAQSEAATGKSWVRYWMHCEHILLNNEKISKSTGNYVLLDDLAREGISPEAYKLLVYGTHYRKNMNFALESLQAAQKSIDRLKLLVIDLKSKVDEDCTTLLKTDLSEVSQIAQFKAAICNDLNMAQAVAILWEIANASIEPKLKLAALLNIDQVLAFDMQNWKADSITITPEVKTLLDARHLARQNKQWAESDRLRDEIKNLGFEVLDAAGEQKLKKL